MIGNHRHGPRNILILTYVPRLDLLPCPLPPVGICGVAHLLVLRCHRVVQLLLVVNLIAVELAEEEGEQSGKEEHLS